jgi:hypothetical protein
MVNVINMGEYQKLKAEFDRKVKELQDNCSHEETQQPKYAITPGHYWGSVEVCKRCGKIIEKAKKSIERGGEHG